MRSFSMLRWRKSARGHTVFISVILFSQHAHEKVVSQVGEEVLRHQMRGHTTAARIQTHLGHRVITMPVQPLVDVDWEALRVRHLVPSLWCCWGQLLAISERESPSTARVRGGRLISGLRRHSGKVSLRTRGCVSRKTVRAVVISPDLGEDASAALLLAYLNHIVLFVGTREELLEAPMLQLPLQRCEYSPVCMAQHRLTD